MHPSRILLPLLFALGACSASTEPSDPRGLLIQNRALWASASIRDYQYTVARYCFCTPESSGPVIVEVRSGKVATARYIGGAAVDPQFSGLFTNVPGLFDLIEEALNRPAAAVSARYDPSLGYPESIQIDWVAGAVDDEVSYRITDFSTLPRP